MLHTVSQPFLRQRQSVQGERPARSAQVFSATIAPAVSGNDLSINVIASDDSLAHDFRAEPQRQMSGGDSVEN